MATWVLGDIHGHFDTLQALWQRLDFDAERDRLWLVGDLVNRGPQSLEVLRWVRQKDRRLGQNMQVVLGNHDLHLLALHDGLQEPRPKDSDLLQILEAPDRPALMRWLRRRPLLHRDEVAGHAVAMVHAGLLPQWTLDDAETWARQLEARLARTKGTAALLVRRPPDKPKALGRWHALEAMTRLRLMQEVGGEPCSFKGPPGAAPSGCIPWFQYPERKTVGQRVIFGHWAALGLHCDDGVICIDSGCAWGKRLSAYRLDDGHLVQQDVLEPARSH